MDHATQETIIKSESMPIARNRRVSCRIPHAFIVLLITAAMLLPVTCLKADPVYAATTPYPAPELTQLQYYKTAKGSYDAKLSWKSKKGQTYQVLRKKGNESWKVIARVKATASTASYVNTNIGGKASYTYTVRRVSLKNGKVKERGKYDKTGIRTLAKPVMSVSFTNLNAKISWKKVPGATKYLIYRKIDDSDKFRLLAKVSSKELSYTDVYADSSANPKMMAILKTNYFVDPAENPISYYVRAYSGVKEGKVTKKSYGLYLRDGIYHLEPPAIVSLENGVLKWGTVPHASGYIIKSKKSKDEAWTEIARVPAEPTTSIYQSVNIELGDPDTYYGIQAFAERNGKVEYSKYGTGFTLKNSSIGKGTNVLFFGDSLTFGSPYFGQQRGSFSYANRIRQLTGISLLNTAVSGATWHFNPNNQRVNIVNGVANMIALGETTDHAYASPQIGDNTQTFEDFDIVFLAAGTNDYTDKTKTSLGSRETDWEKISDKTTDISFTVNAAYPQAKTYTGMNYDYNISTFDGSYNQIYKYIEEASIRRVLKGKPPIKVVSIGLFYSNRTGTSPRISSRNTTKNALGFTLLKYQAEMKALNNVWANSPVLDVYFYDSQATGIVSDKNCKYRTVDNLHFSRYTYGLYGDSMADFMINSGVFDRMSSSGINELRNSDAFKALLEKYARSPAFAESLDYNLKSTICRILGISDLSELIVEPEPEPAVEPATGNEPNMVASGEEDKADSVDSGTLQTDGQEDGTYAADGYGQSSQQDVISGE